MLAAIADTHMLVVKWLDATTVCTYLVLVWWYGGTIPHVGCHEEKRRKVDEEGKTPKVTPTLKL